MDDLILLAARTAKAAHEGQLRKYHRLPYILHPARVASRVTLIDDATAEEIAAAWLHDVIEDCDYTSERLREIGFPPLTVQLVEELTNPSTFADNLPRRERKALDRDHIAQVSFEAKRIKLADRVDNLRDMTLADDKFKSLYVAESLLLRDQLREVDDELLHEFHFAIEQLGFGLDHTDPRANSTD